MGLYKTRLNGILIPNDQLPDYKIKRHYKSKYVPKPKVHLLTEAEVDALIEKRNPGWIKRHTQEVLNADRAKEQKIP